MIDPNNLWSAARVASLIGVPESRLARWRSKGVGPSYVKIEGRIAYPADLLVEFLNASLVMAKGAKILNCSEYRQVRQAHQSPILFRVLDPK